ncbi:MAG: nucleoside deaminase [Bacteroidetes bacterium]|nr:nucleoside deaminase [Bacteroidota bacterium]
MSENLFDDELWMRKALDLAHQAAEEDEIPIGAVVVYKNQVIGKGYNQTEKLKDVTAHAEMLAITAAASWLNNKFLEDCTLYVTIEPCLMCAGAIHWSRPSRLVYGASEPKFGFSGVRNDLTGLHTEVTGGVLASECAQLMKDFFRTKRS